MTEARRAGLDDMYSPPPVPNKTKDLRKWGFMSAYPEQGGEGTAELSGATQSEVFVTKNLNRNNMLCACITASTSSSSSAAGLRSTNSY
jgi:hypothetical protein